MDDRAYDSVLLTKFEETLKNEMSLDFKPKNVCIICYDECIVTGYLVSDVANEISNIPTTVTTDLRIPGWLSEESMVILITNSDKMKELESTVEKLKGCKCKIVVISDSFTSDIKDVLLMLKVGSEGKFEYLGEVLGYLFLLFDKMGIIHKKEVADIIPSMAEMHDKITKGVEKYDVGHYSKRNLLISFPPNFRSTAGLLQMIFFRRLKVATYISEYPEYNHNEIVGWCMSPEQSKHYVNLFIVDGNTTETMNTISKSMIDVLTKSGVEILKVNIDGKNNLEKNLTGFLIAETIPKLEDVK